VVQHISTEEVDDSEDENAQPPTKPSVFDRLQPSTSKKRPSIFTRIGRSQNPNPSIFWRVKSHAQPKLSVFNRIMKEKQSPSPLSQEQKDSVFNRLGDRNKAQSSIPSHMKRFLTLNVKTDGLQRVKRRTVVFTGQQSNSDTNKGDKQEQVTSSNHIRVQKCEDLESKIELPKLMKTR